MYSKDKKFTVYMHITPNGKKYIGITCQIPEKRWYDGKGYSRCPHFYAAINKYGWDNIEHIIITEGLTETEALKAEQDWIKYWDTLNPKNGYNLTKGGDTTTLGYKYPIEIRKRMGNPIYQFDIKGNFIKEWISAEYAGSALNCSVTCIRNVCKRKLRYSHNSIWRYKDDELFIKNKPWSNYVKEAIVREYKTIKKDKTGPSKRNRPIFQYSINNDFIKKWNNAQEIADYLNVSRSSVYNACRKMTETCGGYILSYEKNNKYAQSSHVKSHN